MTKKNTTKKAPKAKLAAAPKTSRKAPRIAKKAAARKAPARKSKAK
jgi:hypothetical protein